MNTRTETDSFGSIEIPADRLYGVQTARAAANFAVGEQRMPLAIVHAYGVIKEAAALTNGELGLLETDVADAIAAAARRLARGELDDHFPLHVWQSGSGTQTHMNVNEVLAHLASQPASAAEGERRTVHPNDHVNRGQSTNDTFPTAMHLAAVDQLQTRLLPALRALIGTLDGLAARHTDVIKAGRTHLQDATPLTLAQEVSGWSAQLRQAEAALCGCLPGLYQLALGGTAVGTGLNSHPRFARLAIARIAERTGEPFRCADNRFAALAGHDACVALSGALRQLATASMKLANDVRWLASGPRCGLGELQIPANEPGSSIMPGKVNPTQCEMLSMVCCQVMGNDVALGIAASQGNFELNAYKPLLAHNLLGSLDLLADALASFDARCARGIEPRTQRMAQYLEQSLMLVTALTPHIGYDAAAKIAKHAAGRDLTLREAALELGLVDAESFDAWVRPQDMVAPHP